jgi:phosphate transport system permease protein
VFLQTPTTHEEAALALGATRWEMIRIAVLPFGRPGVITAALLGLGRAMGETIAVALIFPATFDISFHILGPSGNSIAANIANGFGEATPIGQGALIASGLVLFVITLLVNIAARLIIARRKEYARAAT